MILTVVANTNIWLYNYIYIIIVNLIMEWLMFGSYSSCLYYPVLNSIVCSIIATRRRGRVLNDHDEDDDMH